MPVCDTTALYVAAPSTRISRHDNSHFWTVSPRLDVLHHGRWPQPRQPGRLHTCGSITVLYSIWLEVRKGRRWQQCRHRHLLKGASVAGCCCPAGCLAQYVAPKSWVCGPGPVSNNAILYPRRARWRQRVPPGNQAAVFTTSHEICSWTSPRLHLHSTTQYFAEHWPCPNLPTQAQAAPSRARTPGCAAGCCCAAA